jgi:ABC-type Co2+ transport system permease subunit
MRSRVRQTELLPHGAGDAIRQLALFALAYGGYSLVRGIVAGSGSRPFADASRIIALERSLHVFVEPAIEGWAHAHPPLVSIALLVYLNAHLTVSAATLVYLYLRRNGSFYFVRNTAIVAMVIALAGYALYPTAPPRMLPGWGFSDPLHGLGPGGVGGAVVNVYAAVPSMHVCFAAIVGGTMARLAARRAVRALWLLYPLLVTAAVLLTGNHFLTDIVLGLLTAGVSALVSHALLARARPDVWTFAGPTAYCPDRSHA